MSTTYGASAEDIRAIVVAQNEPTEYECIRLHASDGRIERVNVTFRQGVPYHPDNPLLDDAFEQVEDTLVAFWTRTEEPSPGWCLLEEIGEPSGPRTRARPGDMLMVDTRVTTLAQPGEHHGNRDHHTAMQPQDMSASSEAVIRARAHRVPDDQADQRRRTQLMQHLTAGAGCGLLNVRCCYTGL